MGGWIDQALVSATNLILLLVLARWAGASDVGYYSIGFSVIMMAISVQDSLVTRPYSVQMLNFPYRPEEHSGGALVLASGIGLVIAAVGLATTAIIAIADRSEDAISISLVLGFALPFLLIREFIRRYSFAHLQTWHAVGVDAATLGLLGLAVAVLVLNEAMAASTAVAALGGACAISAGIWIVLRRNLFKFSGNPIAETCRQSLVFGKWLLASQMAIQAQGYSTHWIIFAFAGSATTGVYAGCLSIVALSNPLLFGYLNLLTPRFVRAYDEGGSEALRKHAISSAKFLGGLIGLFAVGVIVSGDWLIASLFPGEAFEAGFTLLAPLALAAVAGAIGAPAAVALTAAERGRPVAMLSTLSLFLGSLLVLALMARWGLEAAVFGVLLSETLASVARWIALGQLLPGKSAGVPSIATQA